jgi:hypothetical protein
MQSARGVSVVILGINAALSVASASVIVSRRGAVFACSPQRELWVTRNMKSTKPRSGGPVRRIAAAASRLRSMYLLRLHGLTPMARCDRRFATEDARGREYA